MWNRHAQRQYQGALYVFGQGARDKRLWHTNAATATALLGVAILGHLRCGH